MLQKILLLILKVHLQLNKTGLDKEVDENEVTEKGTKLRKKTVGRHQRSTGRVIVS